MAAYETSRTTLTSQVTSTEQLQVVETTQTLTSWTATVIIDNPSHWPIQVFAGVAYPRGETRGDISFPRWGLRPGLQAKDYSGRIVDVTDPSAIRIPKFASCYTYTRYLRSAYYSSIDRWYHYYGISRWTPQPTSERGPIYEALDTETFQHYVSVVPLIPRSVTVCGDEVFFFDNIMPNIGNAYNQRVSFPSQIKWYMKILVTIYSEEDGRTYLTDLSYYSESIHKLAYIVVVDLWNTTNIVAYSTGGTLMVNATGPLGIAAVYTFDRTVERLPPPPPPPLSTGCNNIYTVNVCKSDDVGTQIHGSNTWVAVECGSPMPSTITATFQTNNPSGCDAFIAPSAGTYSVNQVQPCPKDGENITCTVPPGTTLILDCDH